MYHPTRGGTRGGVDQFTWEAVKSDKYRENYLGHSLKAPVGRWQKGKDLTWYTKEKQNAVGKGGSTLAKEELLAIKQAEEMALLAALGHKSISRNVQQLSREELSDALKRGQTERDELNVECIEGLGLSSRLHPSLAPSRRVTEGVAFVGLGHELKNDNTAQENSSDAGKKDSMTPVPVYKHKKKKKHKKRHSRHASSGSEDQFDSRKKAHLHSSQESCSSKRNRNEQLHSKGTDKERQSKDSHRKRQHSSSPEISHKHLKHGKRSRTSSHQPRDFKSRLDSASSEDVSLKQSSSHPISRHKRVRHDSDTE